ncbi:cubilin-like isoform X3 [Crassostrea virginica]
MRCTWNISKDGLQSSWFKISVLEDSQNCLTSFQMDFKDELCSKENKNKSIVLIDDAMFVTFYSRSTGLASSILVEVVPELSFPTNLTTTVNTDVITVNWTWNGTYYDDLLCVIEFSVYPSEISSRVDMNCSDLSYSLDTSNHRGQRYRVRMFAKTSFWESQKLDYLEQTSECRNEIFISRENQTYLSSDGYPYHLQPFSNCSWKINTDDDTYLKVYVHDIGFCSNLQGAGGCPETTCLQIDQNIRLCTGTQNFKKEYLLKQNSTVIMLNTSREIGGRGFNLSIKAVDSPPPFIEQFHVESQHDSINVTWRPYTGPKTLQRYIITYRIVPEVAYHVVPIHVNTSSYVIDTNSRRGQMFAVRLSYLTEGGEGIPSVIKIIRAACGFTTVLRHGQSVVVTSPTIHGHYQANVFCKWNIISSQSLWYKFNFNSIDIENSTLCLKDYVEFPTNRKYCGNRTGSVVIRNSRATIAFVTDDSNSGSGFNGTITALYPPSSKPLNHTLTRTQYGLLVQWEKPLVDPSFVRGYRISYKLQDELEVYELIVSANQYSAFINTRNYPGSLFDVWISAIGETDDSETTGHMQSYSECGKDMVINKSMQFISTPFYPEHTNVTCRCLWTVSSARNYTLSIININRPNISINTSSNEYLMINARKHSLQNIRNGMQFTFAANEPLTVEIRSKKTNILVSLQAIQSHLTIRRDANSAQMPLKGPS